MYVTVKTLNEKGQNERNVTLAFDYITGETSLLGNLPHNTTIVINQKLVDKLQEIVDNKTTARRIPA